MAALGFLGGLIVTYREVEPGGGDVPKISDLLPWWVPAALFTAIIFLGFLNMIERFSQSKDERERFKNVMGIVQPLSTSMSAGAGLGVALGWSVATAAKANRADVTYVMFIPLFMLAIGLAIAIGVSSDRLKTWHARLNP